MECVSYKTASVNLGPISRWSLTAVGTVFVSLLLHTGLACSGGRGRQSVLSQTVLTVGESLHPLPCEVSEGRGCLTVRASRGVQGGGGWADKATLDASLDEGATPFPCGLCTTIAKPFPAWRASRARPLAAV